MGFDFIIEYKKGKENIADALSRRHEVDDKYGGLCAPSQPVPHWIESIKEEVSTSTTMQELVQRIKQGEALGPWKLNYGLVLFKDKIFLSQNSTLATEIIKAISW
ncbi:hypothetical protein EZV62_004108 [Acer yangbiense]|uniref:Uncharacterized protein n=1 Tax=Acer yangbiense TaxID=1000413 RepID=A0A5C7IIT7_9ROSI|nr:hypothetical protein EZV62_004108 [Acer yangbiense]